MYALCFCKCRTPDADGQQTNCPSDRFGSSNAIAPGQTLPSPEIDKSRPVSCLALHTYPSAVISQRINE